MTSETVSFIEVLSLQKFFTSQHLDDHVLERRGRGAADVTDPVRPTKALQSGAVVLKRLAIFSQQTFRQRDFAEAVCFGVLQSQIAEQFGIRFLRRNAVDNKDLKLLVTQSVQSGDGVFVVE